MHWVNGAVVLSNLFCNSFYADKHKCVFPLQRRLYLKNVVFEEGSNIYKIKSFAFSSCRWLETITLPEGVELLYTYSFRNMAALSEIILPESVTFIGDNVFMDTPNVTLSVIENSYSHTYAEENGYEYIPCQYLTLSSCENETTYNIVKKYKLDISFNVRDGITISDEWLEKYRALGCKLAVFTFEEWASYNDIQTWINRGVDFVTTDWHSLDKLELPKSNDN